MLFKRHKNTLVHQFIANINNINKLLLNSNNKKIWRCQKYINFNWHWHFWEWITSKGIVAFVNHLIKNHSILIIFSTQITHVFDILHSTKLQQQALFQPKQHLLSSNSNFNKQTLKVHFLTWIVANNLSQSIIKSFFFHSFLQYINLNVNELLFKDSKTIRKNLCCIVNNFKSYIQHSLNTTLFKIHIICDAWTSPNGYAIWGIQAQYFDLKSDLQCIIIKLKHFRSSYNGWFLASITYTTIKHYRFAKNLKYIILNNASTNDILINTLTNCLSNINVNWNSIQYYIYCFGHIMNLIISTFIYINSKDMLPIDDAIR